MSSGCISVSPVLTSLFLSFSALESKLVSQFCEDENGALIYNRVTNTYNSYGNNGYNSNRNGNNGKYATGGYGYRPVTEQQIDTGGQSGTNTGPGSDNGRVQMVTPQHGSKESSSKHVRNV